MKNAIVTYASGRTDYGLTVREREVLALASMGLTGPQIAREHGVEASTVRTQMKGIYRKLKVHNRASAVAKALNENLIGNNVNGASRPDLLLTPSGGAARRGGWRRSASQTRGSAGDCSVTCPYCGHELMTKPRPSNRMNKIPNIKTDPIALPAECRAVPFSFEIQTVIANQP